MKIDNVFLAGFARSLDKKGAAIVANIEKEVEVITPKPIKIKRVFPKSELEEYMDNIYSNDQVFTVTFKDIEGGCMAEERDIDDNVIRNLFLSDKKRFV